MSTRQADANRHRIASWSSRSATRLLHYANQQIRAVGRVRARAVEADRPDDFPDQDAWNREGYGVEVEYRELAEPIALETIPAELRTPRAGPFTSAGSRAAGVLLPRR